MKAAQATVSKAEKAVLEAATNYNNAVSQTKGPNKQVLRTQSTAPAGSSERAIPGTEQQSFGEYTAGMRIGGLAYHWAKQKYQGK
jgi:hypothetical protein